MTRKVEDEYGAVGLDECPTPRKCRCGACICGDQKHTAVHGPYYGQAEGSKPWGHRFHPANER